MTRKESIQKRLQKMRPSRVQLAYDVKIGNAVETKELPFMVGVMTDLSGQSEVQQPKLRDRKLVSIDRDNFGKAMRGVGSRMAFQVSDTPTENGGRFDVDLKFRSLEDSSPEVVVKQVEPLYKLLEARSELTDLRNKMAGNDKFEDLLSEMLENTENAKKLGARQNRDGNA